MNPVIIFGAGSLGKTALDILKSNQLIVYGFLDDNAALHGNEIGEVSILGTTEDDGFLKLIGQKCDALIAVESSKERAFLFDLLKERRHVMPANAIHANAHVSEYAVLGHGNILAGGCQVGAFSTIGDCCVLYSNAILETDAILGSHVTIGSGSIVGAGTEVANGVFIGPGATILPGIKIAKNASIGAGSVVLADVAAGSKMFGYPAQKV